MESVVSNNHKNPDEGTCLFLINGLGMGNSTRCHAIIEYLVERGVRVHILTSGNGLVYFSRIGGIASLSTMDSFSYSAGNGGVSGWKTLASLHSLYGRAKAKQRQLEAFLQAHRIDVAITDSEYITAPLRRRRIPVIGLNNADVVVAEYLKLKHVPPGIRSHFWLVEFTDYLFHRFFCDVVISPSAVPCPARHPKIKRVGIIVRREVLKAPRCLSRAVFPAPLRTVVFLLSGSVFASKIDLSGGQFPFTVDVIGREGKNTGQVTYHGRKLDAVSHIASADALVINGGFSAVSEAIVLGKPILVIPVPGHAEQYVNALTVARLGCGHIVHEDEVLDRLMSVYLTKRWEGLGEHQPMTDANGACEAADIIVEMIRRRHSSLQGRGAS